MINVFDNGGKTTDRYTVVIFERGSYEVYGMSENASMPNGFNQYYGQLGLDVEQSYLDEQKEIRLTDLPKAVLIAIIERLETVAELID